MKRQVSLADRLGQRMGVEFEGQASQDEPYWTIKGNNRRFLNKGVDLMTAIMKLLRMIVQMLPEF